MNLIAHVEIPVTNLDRAIAFYTEVFQIIIDEIIEIHGNKMAFFPFDEQKNGASGALVMGEVYVPTIKGAIVYFSVKDIDDTLTKAVACGSDILFPKTSIGEQGFVAEIKDSEGNRIALISK